MKRKDVSKKMAYLLRHDPSGLEIDEEGFVDLNELLGRLRERWAELDEEGLRSLVEEDPKGRYEVSDGKVRARYGHSIDVEPDLPEVEVDRLYHGTTREALRRIREEGLKSRGRRKVHLSTTEEEAERVGRRHAPDPVVLEVRAAEAREAGVSFEKASDRVYVTDYVPPEFVALADGTEVDSD